jgi:hypothetical protein
MRPEPEMDSYRKDSTFPGQCPAAFLFSEVHFRLITKDDLGKNGEKTVNAGF